MTFQNIHPQSDDLPKCDLPLLSPALVHLPSRPFQEVDFQYFLDPQEVSIHQSMCSLYWLTNSLAANLNFVGNQTISISKIKGREMGTRQYQLLPWTEVEDWKIIVDFRSPLFLSTVFPPVSKSTEINKHCLIGSKISIGILYLIVTQDKVLDHLVEWK